jgi:hypothetical protein
VLAACQKETPHGTTATESYISTVKKNIQAKMAANDYARLDIENMILSSVDSVQLYTVRIPFKGESLQERFVLLHADKEGDVLQSRIVELSGGVTVDSTTKVARFNGAITLYDLDGQNKLQSSITNGYIDRFRDMTRRALSQPSSGNLPEVVVVGYIDGGNDGVSFSTWMAMMNLFNNSSSWQYANYYSAMSPGTYSGGGGSANGSWSYTTPLAIDFENQYSEPAIDLQKYINCFNALPDAGAACAIEIFTDIPVDNDPYKLFNWEIGSPGHTFLRIRKTNGGQVVQQSIGFYPESAWKTALTNAPIKGKFVDNGGHEFNASLRMNLTPDQLKQVLAELQYLQNMRYDIDEFNCTDWALAVFNHVRSHPLEIPLYDIPGGMTARGTSTPQGLYNKLKEMKNSGGPEAATITVGTAKSYVGSSKGPCN